MTHGIGKGVFHSVVPFSGGLIYNPRSQNDHPIVKKGSSDAESSGGVPVNLDMPLKTTVADANHSRAFGKPHVPGFSFVEGFQTSGVFSDSVGDHGL